MNKYIKLVLRYPKSIILSIIIITILLSLGIPKLRFDSSIDVMMPQEDSEYLYYNKIKTIYRNPGKFVIMSISSKNLWSEKTFSKMDELVSDLEEYESFDEEREKGRIEIFKKIVIQKEIKFEDILKKYKEDPSFQRQLKWQRQSLFKGKSKLGKQDLEKFLKKIESSYKLKKSGQIDSIITPITASDISGSNDVLEAKKLLEEDDNGKRIIPKSEKDFENFRKKLQKNPAFDRALYSKNKDGEITDFALVIMLNDVKEDDKIAKEISDLVTNDRDLDIILQGVPIVNKWMNDYMHEDLFTFMPLVILVVVIVFFFNFMTLRGVFLPFITLVLADLWILGFMGHIGVRISIIGVSLPTLMVAVGSSYSIHILNQYYIDFQEITRKGKIEGLRLSMAHISVTVLLAGLTTFIGFASLLSNQVVGIKEWGICSALGVLFAVFISTSLIPAAFSLLPHKKGSTKISQENSSDKTWITPIIRTFVKFSIKHYKFVIITMVLVIIISTIGLFKIKVETAIMTYFKKDDYIRTSSNIIGEKFGGSYGLSILINSGEENGVKDPKFLNTVEEVRQWLVDKKNWDISITRTNSFTDIIKSMHQAMNNDNPDYYRIPDTRNEIAEYLEIFSGDDDNYDGRPDDFESLVDPEYRTLLIFAKLWNYKDAKHGEVMGTSDFEHSTKRISKYLDNKFKGTKLTYKVTGEPAIFVRLSDYVIQGQLVSLLFCLFAVSIVVILLFKNYKSGIIALIPMSTAVIINFGIMGWLGIYLDTATAIIASITIGIGIDDTIHFLNTYRHFRSKNLSIDETIEKTLFISGKAITYTSLALIFGFLVLALSNFKPVMLFGVLVALTMVATTIGALVLLPAVIKATEVSLDMSKSESWFWRIFYIGRYFNLDEDGDL